MTALTYKLDGRLEDGFKFSPVKLTAHGRNVLKAAVAYHCRKRPYGLGLSFPWTNPAGERGAFRITVDLKNATKRGCSSVNLGNLGSIRV